MIIPLLIGACLSNIFNFSGAIIFLLSSLVGIRLTKLEGNTKINIIRKKILYSSIQNNKEPAGLAIGKWFICFFSETMQNENSVNIIYLISTKNFINKILNKNDMIDTDMDDIDDDIDNDMDENNTNRNQKKDKKGITLYQREGNYWNFRYESRIFYPKRMLERCSQSFILDAIESRYTFEDQKLCSIIISGEPGNGKSTIAILLAKRLLILNNYIEKVNFVDSWNPTDPGDTFENIYTTILPNKKEPLIVVLEEIDGIITSIHNSKIERHKIVPIPMTCKKDWNSFFDKFSNGRYPYTYIICTTNKTFDDFDKMDTSYLRNNRINLKYKMN
jgi:hypothetical protein